MIDNIILGMLFDCSLTGYGLKNAIENGIGVFYQASFGSIYPALKRLSEKGRVTMKENGEGGRNRKEYIITEEGKTHFLQWLSQPVAYEDANKNQLLRIYFYDKLPGDIRVEYLRDYEVNIKKYLRKLLALKESLDTEENREHHYYKLSTLYYGICVTETALEWCRLIQKKLTLESMGEGMK